MKIGFFGNVNNFPFMLARAIRRAGHEVVFIVGSLQQLDRPEFRYTDVSSVGTDWIHDVSPFNFWDAAFPTFKRARVVRLLRECDAVILNLSGIALRSYIQRPSIALLTGSDIELYATLSYPQQRAFEGRRRPRFIFRALSLFLWNRLVVMQREGIKNADVVNYIARGLVPEGDGILDDLGVSDSRRIVILMTDTEDIREAPAPANRIPRALCVTRFTWKKPRDPGRSERDYKGSDIMIRGMGLFFRKTGMRLDVRFGRKGAHVSEAEELTKEEGIADQVTWLEDMSQIQVLEEFRQADFVLDQFGESIVGMAGLDAMAVGRPLIANWRPEIMDRAVGEVSPVCQARTPEEVCAQLQRVVLDRGERERIGRASRLFVEKYFSADAAARLCLSRLARFN